MGHITVSKEDVIVVQTPINNLLLYRSKLISINLSEISIVRTTVLGHRAVFCHFAAPV